jgi:hypothetical protein
MFGEATPDVSGTFAGEAIRVFILFVAQQINPPHRRHFVPPLVAQVPN